MFKWAKLYGQNSAEKEITSPNKRTRCFFILKNGEIFYRVERDDKILIGLSKSLFLNLNKIAESRLHHKVLLFRAA